MGCAKFMGADGELVGLKNVLWVPDLCANLISTGRLGDAGVNTETIGSERYRAYNDERLIWDLQWKGDVHKRMWQIPVLPWQKSGKAAAAASMEESVTEEEQQGVQGEELIGGSAAVKASATSGQADWETWQVAARRGLVEERNIPVLPWRKSGKAAVAASMEESVTEEEQQGVQGEELIGGSAAVKASATSGQADWETWHRRLAHVAVSTLEVMHKEKCVHGLQLRRDDAHYGRCEACMQNKFARFSFPRAEGSAKAPLEVVHMDL
ncbi:unnamed protein product, partial [Closterium sp. NIES-54]